MHRVISTLPVAVIAAGLLAFPSFAQKSGGGSTGGGGASTTTGGSTGTSLGGSKGTITNVPNNNNPINNNNTPGGYEQSRPIFLSGNVMFDDGSAPNNEIRIERVCNGSPHVETHTDSKGRFSFQLGGDPGSSIAEADSSNNNFGVQSAGNPLSSLGGSSGTGSGFNNQNLMGCELRAAYPGYVSEVVELSMRHSLDDPKVGTILLHRLGNVKGTTISLTTAEAPKSAVKSYEKGNQLAMKGKFEEAEEHFQSATTTYPKFAAAWFALGQVQQQLKRPEDAKKSYLAATAADSHYVSPWDRLAYISAQEGKWDEAAKYSKEATDLNPVEFPTSFWYNALANYNLRKVADAEKSVRALLKLDSRHRFPQAETMMAEFAANRGDLDDAAAHLRAFLAEAPNAQNADLVKSELLRVEQARATQAKNTPAAH